MTYDLCLHNGEVVVPGEGLRRMSIGIRDGRIAALIEAGETVRATRVIDCTGKWVFPGVIDPHTHIGFGDKANDWASETQTAMLGGVTGLMSFWRAESLTESAGPWREEGLARSRIDFGLHFGITSQSHIEELPHAARTHGVTSIKVYLMYKGETGAAKGFTEVDDALLFRALQVGARIPGGVVGVHCENTEVIPVFRAPLKEAGRNDLPAWNAQSPDFLETENVFRVAFFGAKAGCPVNIVHMSALESLDLVRRMRHPSRPPIHVETCIHYLSLSENAPIGLHGKVNPPLRTQADIDGLWEGVREGDISTIGSDHVPRKAATKGPDLWRASAGFPGIAQILPVLLEEGHHKRGIPLQTLAAATSRNVARLYNLDGKGCIAPGYDADFAIVDPDGETLVDHAALPSHSDYSPYQGKRCRGAITHTVLRGNILVEDGRPAPVPGTTGRYIQRNAGKETT